MANQWFRLYSEFSHDPKVQMLSEAMQRRYIMLMCLRCSNVTETLHETEIAFSLRISEAELAETKSLFIAKGFIDSDWKLLNWEKRQFASDSSAARVYKHRQKKKQDGNADVTLQKRQSNAPEQNRTEQITTLSGKPDAVNGKRSDAVEVLEYLNLKTSRAYRPTEANLKLIAGRLREGATVADCKTVIDRKTDQWRNDDKMAEYLRPATLFNATKFSQYQGETGNVSGKSPFDGAL